MLDKLILEKLNQEAELSSVKELNKILSKDLCSVKEKLELLSGENVMLKNSIVALNSEKTDRYKSISDELSSLERKVERISTQSLNENVLENLSTQLS